MKVTNYEEGRQTPKSLVGLRHVGLSAQNPAALADVYPVVLGLDIVPTDTAALGPTAFLSSHLEQGSVDLVSFGNAVLQHIVLAH